MNLFERFFSTEGFMPHGMCLLWRPEVFWLHAVSDTLIALSYYSIPLAILYFVHRRKDMAFPWVFYMFGAFILACGTTHLLAVWTLWRPDYGFDGLVKALTAGLSIATAVALWPLMPKALALPSQGELKRANERLKREIAVREAAEARVRRLNEDLESRALERAAELARRELTYRAVIESMLDAFILMDQHGRILEWNPQAETMFGWPADEAVGRLVMDTVIPEPQRAGHERGLRHFLETGEHALLERRVEVTALRRDGKTFPAELMIMPLHVGGAWVFSGFVRDISEQKRAEEQLRQAQKMDAIGQMTGGVAHDFNNLLTVVITCLDLLETKLVEDEFSQKLAQNALNAALRGADLTRQLLAFARRQTLEGRAFDLNETVATTTHLLKRTLGEQVEIELHLARDLAPAFADASQVGNALTNLAINARDAMPKGGKLIIETADKHLDEAYAADNPDVAPGDYAMLAVTDTGTGMDRDVLDRVFEPFFTTKSEGKGSGLGLSMVYGFAKQSGGHVKIYSEPGHGTTVRLYLPRAGADSAPRQAPEAQAPTAPHQPGAVILVVEDNADVRRGVIAQITALGYRPISAEDGAAALAVLERGEHVDLLFTDIVMPGMSGVALAAEARRMRPDLRVLYTTGYAEAAPQNGDRPHARSISKPYRMAELERIIRETLAEPPQGAPS